MTTWNIYTYAERPVPDEMRGDLLKSWPVFMLEDPVANENWDFLYSKFPDFQFFIYDEHDRLVAEGNTIPVRWDDAPEALPEEGWDWALRSGVKNFDEGIQPNLVSALSATILKSEQGKGISTVIIETMRSIAARHGLKSLVAPVRPSMKTLYPLAPMERYVTWTRADGSPLDAWMRVHWRLGARVVRVAPLSMRIPGTLAEWERWSGLVFPESGPYVVPGALVPVQVDYENDQAVYIEPNVWMLHKL